MALQALRYLKENLQKNHSSALKIGGNAAIAAVLYGLEEMLEKISPCPCHPEWNATYSKVVFVVPAVILYMISLVVYPDSRRVLKCAPACTLPRGETAGCCNTCCTWHQFAFAAMTFLKAGIPSFFWVIIVFLDGSYYACWKDRTATRETCKGYCSMNLRDHCFESRIIGAILLVVTVTLLVLLYFLSACKCKDCKCRDCTVESYYESKYQKMLEKEKRTKMKEKLKTMATKSAEASAERVIDTLNLGKPEPNVQQDNQSEGEKNKTVRDKTTPNAIPMTSVH